jgi:flagellum-specific peptidoglycan hydrolase FlgJ
MQSRKEKRLENEKKNKKRHVKRSFFYAGTLNFLTLTQEKTLANETYQPVIEQENTISINDEKMPLSTPIIMNDRTSNLNGFELPTMSSYMYPSQAAIIAKGIALLNEESKDVTIVNETPLTYQVVYGDTLNAIALRYKTTIEQLLKDNPVIEDKNLIFPGQIFVVGHEKTSDDTTATISKEKLNSLNFVNNIYSFVFNEKIADNLTQIPENYRKLAVNERTPGDLIIEDKKISIYLGNEKQLVCSNNVVKIEPFFQSQTQEFYRPNYQLPLSQEGQKLIEEYEANQVFTYYQATQDFISTISQEAKKLGKENDLYASVMIAQAILESASGTSQLASAPNFNIFGVKGDYYGDSVAFETFEDDGYGNQYKVTSDFRKYNNYEGSLLDYVALLQKGIIGNEEFYAGAWKSKTKNYLEATKFLTGKYATDTTYYQKLNSLIYTYHLTQFDQEEVEMGEIVSEYNQLPIEYQKLVKNPLFDGINRNLSGSYPVGQCTWYVYNRILQLGGSIGEYMGNGGEWGRVGKENGFVVSKMPKAGSAISFEPGVASADRQYGHVAFVEAVGENGILISEQNVVGLGITSYRILSMETAMSDGVSYISPR